MTNTLHRLPAVATYKLVDLGGDLTGGQVLRGPLLGNYPTMVAFPFLTCIGRLKYRSVRIKGRPEIPT